jgi:hypothetical protein
MMELDYRKSREMRGRFLKSGMGFDIIELASQDAGL